MDFTAVILIHSSSPTTSSSLAASLVDEQGSTKHQEELRLWSYHVILRIGWSSVCLGGGVSPTAVNPWWSLRVDLEVLAPRVVELRNHGSSARMSAAALAFRARELARVEG